MKTELACNSDSSVDNNSTVSARRRVPPSSSSLSLPPPVKSEEAANTIIRRRVVKKEEEGVEEDAYNNHDLDDDDDDDDLDDDDDNNNMNGTMNCDALNRGQVQAVKKEEENDDDHDENKETPKPPRSIEDNYDDWKNGNWCWLLSAINNSNVVLNKKTRHSKSVSYTTNHSVASEDGDTNNSTNIADTTTTGILVAVTSTTRRHSYDDDGNNDDDDEKNKPPPKKKMRRCRPINDNVRGEEEGEVEDSVYEYNANNTITNGNNDSCSSSNNNEGDDEGGYESWTKGNWCWLLPFPTAVDDIETGRPSTRRIRMGVNIGDYPYEDDDSGNEHYNADNDVSSVKSKTRKDKIKYATLQNERWDEMFRRLVAYKKENKSTNVPFRYEIDPQLGRWVSHLRDANREPSAVRIRRLNSIGFVWKISVPWMAMYQRLVAYKKKHKSTNIPKGYQADPSLGNWVNTQRKSYNKKELYTDRINHLESIDFVWDPHDTKWMEMYSKLVEYKKQNKSTVVPIIHTEDPPLGRWIGVQRFANNQGKLSEKRLKLLNSINFVWSMKKAS
jgi:hypothetical protein